MTSPLHRGDLAEQAPTGDRFDPDNLVPGTSLARLASFVRNTTPGGQVNEDFTFSSSPAEVAHAGNPNGVPNPYGVGLAAYEPNTQLFSDYEVAYGKVQEEKAAEEAAAQQQLLTLDFTQSGAGTPGNTGVSGVPYADLFTSAGNRYGVPPALLAAVARAESNFQASARSPAGAVGLMQFLPSTAAGLGVNPFDPASAIDGAARYLKQNFDRFHSWDLALAAYNAGPGAVSQYGGIPPYTETQNYVRRVNAYFQEYGQGGHLYTLTSGNGGGGVNFATGGVADANGRTRSFVSAALQLAARSVPYVWGGASANGVDCSGLIYYAARAAGIDWQRYRAVDYGRMGTAVSLSQARPGDIVYYDNPNTDTDHVGIYIGNGQMVQAPFSGQVVKVTGVGNFTSIRRVFDDNAFASSPNPWGQVEPIYGGIPYNPWSQGIVQQALVSLPIFGSTFGRAFAPNPPVIERTQQTGRVRAI